MFILVNTIPLGLSFFRHLWTICLQLFKLLCLARDHLQGFNSRNAHMVNIIEFDIICVKRHMQRYFSHVGDGTDVQAD